MRGFLPIACVGLAGCVGTAVGEIDAPPGTLAILVAVFDPPRPAHVVALPAGAAMPLALREGGEQVLYAFFQTDHTLEELQLETGFVPTSAEPHARALSGDAVAELRLEDGRLVQRPAGALPAAVDGFRFAPFDAIACLEREGCLDAGALEACEIPCPEPSSPEPPELPVLLPCPSGWAEVVRGAVTACRPPSAPELAACETGTTYAQRRHDEDCTPIGDPCPAGEWPESLPPGAVFVKGGPPGNGTRMSPFATIADALRTSPRLIVLAAGDYPEDVAIPAGVTLLGACAERTTITTSTIVSLGAGATLAHVHITGGGRVEAFGVQDVALRGVVVSGSIGQGVVLRASTTATLAGVLVRDAGSRGVALRGSSSAILRDVIIERATGTGLLATHATVEILPPGLVVRATRSSTVPDDVVYGAGFAAREGSTVRGTGVFVEESWLRGLLLDGSGAELGDLEVRRTHPRPIEDDHSYGFGIVLQGSATATLSHVHASSNVAYNVILEQSKLLLDHAVLLGAQRDRHGVAVGMILTHGSTVTARRVAVLDSARAAISVTETSFLDATDVVVHRLEGDPEEVHATIHVFESTVALQRVYAEDVIAPGLFLQSNRPATSTVKDVMISGTQKNGLVMSESMSAVFERVHVEDTIQEGVVVIGPAHAEIVDLNIVAGPRATVAGSGFSVADHASVGVQRFSIRGFPGAGVLVGYMGSPEAPPVVLFEDGEIANNRVGLQIQNPDVVVAGITRRVRFRDNGLGIAPY